MRTKFNNGWHMKPDDWWFELFNVEYYSDFKERELKFTLLNFCIEITY